jgi:hypothetical protein
MTMFFDKIVGVHGNKGAQNKSKQLLLSICFQYFNPFLANFAFEFQKNAYMTKKISLQKISIGI